MTPTQDRWSRSYSRFDDSSRYSYGPQFGSSSRGGYQSRNPFDDDEDWDRPAQTYRTVCVRLCDGYYFPISFSTVPDCFERDSRTCESSCGTQARLFVYRNPGGDIEDMQDLRGHPYRQLRTAFLYRTSYVADCKCQPHPWEDEAKDRHRAYALAAAKRKGDKATVAEQSALDAASRPGASRRSGPSVPVAEEEGPQRPLVALRRRAAPDDDQRDQMSLAGKADRAQHEAKPQQRSRNREWARRNYWQNF